MKLIMTVNNHPQRLLSVDVFRGITIAGMIIVNSPGNQTAYSWLEHSAWNGCTLADLVFPFFLFIVGVSLVLALSKRQQYGNSKTELFFKILIRTIIIFILGLILNAFPYHMHWDSLRIMGVLQHIALCYFFASILFLTTSMRAQGIIFVTILIVYWVIMTKIPVPGYGVNNLTSEANLAAYLDRLILLKEHMYTKVCDPEGILSLLPAIATTLLGNLTGFWLLSKNKAEKKFLGMIFFAIMALIAGWIWSFWFPINKALWTSSFVLWTGGLALIVFAFCYGLTGINQYRAWSKPFEIFGMNAILVYFLHIYFLRIQAMIPMQKLDGRPGNLRFYLTEHLFYWAPSLQMASLLYALNYTLLWLLVLSILYRFKIFIKI